MTSKVIRAKQAEDHEALMVEVVFKPYIYHIHASVPVSVNTAWIIFPVFMLCVINITLRLLAHTETHRSELDVYSVFVFAEVYISKTLEIKNPAHARCNWECR